MSEQTIPLVIVIVVYFAVAFSLSMDSIEKQLRRIADALEKLERLK